MRFSEIDDSLDPSIEKNNYLNVSCDYEHVPSATDSIDAFGVFGTVCLSLGSILLAATIYLSSDASYKIIFSDETKSWKRSVVIIMFVYPVASLCSLLPLAIPRCQLLCESLTQIYLTISLYRLYLVLIEAERREVKKKLPSLRLRVGPCCCWPCLPFPDLAMNPTNLSWLQIIVLQLPIVQTLIYCVLLLMSAENPLLALHYGVFLQPLSISSILLGLYGLSIVIASLQELKSGPGLKHKATVLQLVLLFSKLQGFIVRSLPKTGLFPCNPPITPQIYANFTYNALMLIEMLFLGYAARHVYAYGHEFPTESVVAVARNPENNPNGNDPRIRENNNDDTRPVTRGDEPAV